uniref:Biogenesis of lysosome-related organelles complex 1 subunit 5 n=1 Tax=Pygocentrus nattereri TaxID=42514 RepID=A0A3B4D3Y8_PYGNA
MDKITKDVGDIQSRLLDHRPVLQGEIRYFVREFEEKRGFRECRLLENLNKMVAETNEEVLPKCKECMQDNLCDIFTRSLNYELSELCRQMRSNETPMCGVHDITTTNNWQSQICLKSQARKHGHAGVLGQRKKTDLELAL